MDEYIAYMDLSKQNKDRQSVASRGNVDIQISMVQFIVLQRGSENEAKKMAKKAS